MQRQVMSSNRPDWVQLVFVCSCSCDTTKTFCGIAVSSVPFCLYACSRVHTVWTNDILYCTIFPRLSESSGGTRLWQCFRLGGPWSMFRFMFGFRLRAVTRASAAALAATGRGCLGRRLIECLDRWRRGKCLIQSGCPEELWPWFLVSDFFFFLGFSIVPETFACLSSAYCFACVLEAW